VSGEQHTGTGWLGHKKFCTHRFRTNNHKRYVSSYNRAAVIRFSVFGFFLLNPRRTVIVRRRQSVRSIGFAYSTSTSSLLCTTRVISTRNTRTIYGTPKSWSGVQISTSFIYFSVSKTNVRCTRTTVTSKTSWNCCCDQGGTLLCATTSNIVVVFIFVRREISFGNLLLFSSANKNIVQLENTAIRYTFFTLFVQDSYGPVHYSLIRSGTDWEPIGPETGPPCVFVF